MRFTLIDLKIKFVNTFISSKIHSKILNTFLRVLMVNRGNDNIS